VRPVSSVISGTAWAFATMTPTTGVGGGAAGWLLQDANSEAQIAAADKVNRRKVRLSSR